MNSGPMTVNDTAWFRYQSTASSAKTQCTRRALLPQLIPPLLLFAALLCQLWLRLSTIEKGYELEHLRIESLQNDAALRQKRLTNAYISSPVQLSERAAARLGMKPLTPQQVRRMTVEE